MFKVGHTFTGQGYASITFKDSYFRDALLESSMPSTRAKRSVGNSESTVEIRFRTKKNSGVLFAAISTDKRHSGALYVSRVSLGGFQSFLRSHNMVRFVNEYGIRTIFCQGHNFPWSQAL